jgi:aminopeptidase N
LGSIESRVAIQSLIGIHCGDLVRVDDRAVLLNGVRHEGTGTAILASCHRAQTPGSVVTLLYTMSPQAVSTVSRLVFFYGWNSYVLFKDGAVMTRGDWPAIHSPGDRMEVQWNDQDVAR